MSTATHGDGPAPERRHIYPQASDDWHSIAARELPHLDGDAAVTLLQSCNLHVFMRPRPPEGSPRAGNPILPSDVIFIEPPPGSGAAP
jgi:hypothetical protein